jgi:hypothetical protein
MDIVPGEITSMAYTAQVRINNAIEKDLIGIASAKPCNCTGYQSSPVYNIDR